MIDFANQRNHTTSVSLETDIEPSFLCVGFCNLMVGMNNRIWFYELHTKPENEGCILEVPTFLFDKEYLGNIESVRANADYISVLFEGRIHLHRVSKGYC